MKAISILCILILSTLISCQDSNKDIELANCLNKETVKQLSAFFFDLYVNKVSLESFIQAYKTSTLESEISKQLLCIRELGSDVVRQYFFKDSNTVLSKVGFTLLYESNCAKDVGGALILLDKAVGDLKGVSKNWQQFAVDAAMTAIVSYQGWVDCKSAYEAIRDIWSR
jgi:hypothetical protein